MAHTIQHGTVPRFDPWEEQVRKCRSSADNSKQKKRKWFVVPHIANQHLTLEQQYLLAE